MHEQRPDVFDDAAAALARDALVAGVVLKLVRYEASPEFPATRLYEAFVDGGRRAGLEIPFTTRDNFLIDLAEFVQEVMMDELWAGWPACPVHGEPLVSAIRTDDAAWVWVCHRDGTTSAVGSLRTEHGDLGDRLGGTSNARP